MGIAERFAAPPPRRHHTCKVGRIVATLDKKDQASLTAVLEGPRAAQHGWSDLQIAEGLSSEGHQVGTNSVTRHRDRECACFR